MKEGNKQVAGRAKAKLTYHAVERIMERSARAPSWLAQVLNEGQFAHIAAATREQKRFVLVFDVLTEAYLVAVLPAKSRTVITVLTQEQYENTYGLIAPVIYQLAQLARRKAVESDEDGADAVVEEKKRIGKRLTRQWHANWRAVLKLVPDGRSPVRLTIHMDAHWRQECITAEFRKSSVGLGGETTAAELPFEEQANFLAKNPAFLEWIVKKLELRGEDLESLRSVAIRDVQNKLFSVTKVLFAQLAPECSA
jgi:hypothetical protein